MVVESNFFTDNPPVNSLSNTRAVDVQCYQHRDRQVRKTAKESTRSMDSHAIVLQREPNLSQVTCSLSRAARPDSRSGAKTMFRFAAEFHNTPTMLYLVQDQLRFLTRRFGMIDRWLFQAHSSAIMFSPQFSLVRLGKID
jgi:hypothetical protein